MRVNSPNREVPRWTRKKKFLLEGGRGRKEKRYRKIEKEKNKIN